MPRDKMPETTITKLVEDYGVESVVDWVCASARDDFGSPELFSRFERLMTKASNIARDDELGEEDDSDDDEDEDEDDEDNEPEEE